MGCRITSTRRKGTAAFTLAELMVAMGLSGMAATVLLSFSLFSSRSFLSIANYADMGLKSQIAVDKMAKEIRECRQLTAYTTNSITLLSSDGNSLQFSFSASDRKLSRTKAGQTTALLTGCDTLQFWIFQHTPMSNTFECYAPAYVTNGRLLSVTWTCSRNIMGTKQKTEYSQSEWSWQAF